MKAFVHEYGELKIKDMPEPVAGPGEVVISLRVASLNRRDLMIPERRGDQAEAIILGSDGAGVIESIGEGVEAFNVGDEVIINPALNWEINSNVPPEDFEVLGMPDNGTFAERIVISAKQVERKPKHLSWEYAGTLPLGALTAYRALFTRGQFKKWDTVFIPGAGSGVATFLIIFAKHVGAKVIVTSRSEDKRRKAKHLGADIVLDTASNWVIELKNEEIDLVIESVGKATFNRSLDVLKRGGRMVVFGATTDDHVELDLRAFFYGQYELVGSTMGSKEEFLSMLSFIEKEGIFPEIDCTFTLDNIEEALSYLKEGNQFGKVAIKISE